jgi:hypothetical protein
VKIRTARQGSLFSRKCVEMFQNVSKWTNNLCENKLYHSTRRGWGQAYLLLTGGYGNHLAFAVYKFK